MAHLLILIHKVAGFKLVVILLSVAAVAIVFPLSSALKVHALNVHTEIMATPHGIAQIIEGTGQPPPGIAKHEGEHPTPFTLDPDIDSDTGLTGETQQTGNEPTPPGKDESMPPGIDKIIDEGGIPPGGGGGGGGGAPPPGLVEPKGNRPTTLIINTDIEFGTVFPGETHQGEFTINLSDTEFDDDSPIRVEYHLILSAPSGYEDLTPYLTVWRDTAETDLESDNVTYADGGSQLDSSQTPSDTSDRWLVKLILPDDPTTGDYWTKITVWVDYPQP